MTFAAPSARYVNRMLSESTGTEDISTGKGVVAVSPLLAGGADDMSADLEELRRMFLEIQGRVLGSKGRTRMAEAMSTRRDATIIEWDEKGQGLDSNGALEVVVATEGQGLFAAVGSVRVGAWCCDSVAGGVHLSRGGKYG